MLVCMGFFLFLATEVSAHAVSIVGELTPRACIDYESETRNVRSFDFKFRCTREGQFICKIYIVLCCG